MSIWTRILRLFFSHPMTYSEEYRIRRYKNYIVAERK